MLNVFVCEDNSVQREKITQIIENAILREEFDMKIVVSTGKPEDIIDYLSKSSNTVGIYFLDVDLHSKINGIKLGETIRKFDPRGFIIFITTHSEMSFLTFQYKVEAMDYIIKDNYNNIKIKINECLQKAYSRHYINNMDDKILTVNSDDMVINIKYKDILFFETSQQIHKVRVHEENRHLEFYGTLKEIESTLDDRFYRCHRSFIVNKDKIKSIDKKTRIIYMINDEECYVSTRYIKRLLNSISK